jgi:acyl dehydratase
MTGLAPTAPTVRGKYFEDFKVGEVDVTPARTITQTEIVNFACLTGDFNEVHTNWEYARGTLFWRADRARPARPRRLRRAQLRLGRERRHPDRAARDHRLEMLAPVKHGDTVRMESEVLAVRLSGKRGRGVVEVERRIVNQRGELVQRMSAALLYRTRPTED